MTMAARIRVITLALLAALCVLAIYGVAVGQSPVGPLQVLQALASKISASFAGIFSDLKPWQETIIWQVRLPRVVTGMFVGASLAVAGAVLQGLFRNPLASSDVLGISAGGSLGASIAIFLGLAAAYIWALPFFAIAGAAITMTIVYSLAMREGHAPVATLLLIGIAMNSLNIALYSFVLAMALQQWEVGSSIIYWTLGGLDGRTWDHVAIICPLFIAGTALSLYFTRDLDILVVGEIHAASVGVDVLRMRFWLLAASTLLTGGAVAVSGGIAFIGLIVPHIVRLLVGPHHRHVLPISALGGAFTLIAADLFLRAPFFTANNIPLGALTSAMGAPFFIFLLIKQKRSLNL